MENKFYRWLSFKLPKELVYFCTIRLIAKATVGKYSNTIVSDLTAMDALKRWEDIETEVKVINFNQMKAQKLYLTKQEREKMWNYITDPLHPTTVQQMGLVTVEDKSEIRVDDFGAYVVRSFSKN